MAAWLDKVKFDRQGLVPAIIQDARTRELLMVAYMNREALEKTLRTKKAHFYSRSRRRMWLKGESSGHIQKVKGVRLDCDGDAVLVSVRQVGGACHTGYRSCFYRALTRAVSRAVSIPVIASGGVGTLKHLADGVRKGGADAVLAASIFHFGRYTVPQAKRYLRAQGIPVRA